MQSKKGGQKMPDDSIDWAAFLKSANGEKAPSEAPSLITTCNEGAGLTGMEHFSKDEQGKEKPEK